MAALRRSARANMNRGPVYDGSTQEEDMETAEEEVEEEDEDEEDEEDGDEDVDAVVAQPGSRKRKKAGAKGGYARGKKAAASRGNRSSAFPVQRRKRRAGGSGRNRGNVDDDDDDGVTVKTLFDATRRGEHVSERVAAEWVERYKADRDVALAEYVGFVARAAGVSCDISPEDASDDAERCVNDMIDVGTRDGGEVTFFSKHKDFKSFRGNFLEMHEFIARECYSREVLFDAHLVDKMIAFYVSLSQAPIKEFRYAATLASLQMVSSCVRIVLMVIDARDTAQRQLDAEKKKGGRSSERTTALKRAVDGNQRNVNQLEEVFKRVFSGVVVNRYRDIDVAIRREVIVSLGEWIAAYPSFFLQDTYLKYLGWSLSDKETSVRFAAVRSLANLYAKPDNFPLMELFSDRFRGRIIEMASDVDARVVAEVCTLLKRFVSNDLASVGDLPSIVTLLVDQSAAVRRSAAELLKVILSKCTETLQKPRRGKAAKTAASDTAKKQQIDEMLATADFLKDVCLRPDLMRTAIDSLWDVVGSLHDADAIVSLLLSDEDDDRDEWGAERCTEEQRTVLTWMLLASLQRVSGDIAAPSATLRGKGRIAGLRDDDRASHQQFSALFVTKLLPLLQRFQADEKKVAALVSIIPSMKLEIFGLQRKEDTFTEILGAVRDAFFRHSASPVLDACSKTLAYCTKDAPDAMHAQGRRFIRECTVELQAKLKSAEPIFKKLARDDEDDDANVLKLRMILLRLYRLQDNGADVVDNDMFDNLDHIVSTHSMCPSLSLLVLRIMLSCIQWQVVALDRRDEASHADVSRKIDCLLERACHILDAEHEDVADALKERTFFIAVDTLFLRRAADASCAPEAVTAIASSRDTASHERVMQSLWNFCDTKLDGFDADELSDEDLDDAENDEDEDGDVFEAGDPILEELASCNAASPLAVLAAASRLAAFDAVGSSATTDDNGDAPWFAENLVSHYVEHGQLGANIVKGMIKIVRQRSATDPWKLYLGGLKASFRRYLADTTDTRFAMFQDLSSRISSAYGGVNVKGRAHVADLVRACVRYGTDKPPTRLEFVETTVLALASKLTPENASQIVQEIIALPGVADQIDSKEWQPLRDAVEVLRDKCASDPSSSEDEDEEMGEGDRHATEATTGDDILTKSKSTTDAATGAAAGGRRKISFDAARDGTAIDDEGMTSSDGGRVDTTTGADEEDLVEEEDTDANDGRLPLASLPENRRPTRSRGKLQEATGRATRETSKATTASTGNAAGGFVPPPVNRRLSRRR